MYVVLITTDTLGFGSQGESGVHNISLGPCAVPLHTYPVILPQPDNQFSTHVYRQFLITTSTSKLCLEAIHQLREAVGVYSLHLKKNHITVHLSFRFDI